MKAYFTSRFAYLKAGAFFAPNRKVAFSGDQLEEAATTREGFFVESGTTTVVFKNVEKYVSDPADYPFKSMNIRVGVIGAGPHL